MAAKRNIVLFYANGTHVPLDPVKAFNMMQDIASSGFLNAIFSLASMYEYFLSRTLNICLCNRYDRGPGVPADQRKAVRLYKTAAERGHDGAQCNLGLKVSRPSSSPS